ncbi:hypothetical protein BJV74DRAFT_491703 [Russula compacta]|nr:hypothetical protein BJV74DRAFT_491703 [Russula compacta]
MAAALIDSNIPNLKLVSKGKVRVIHATSSQEHPPPHRRIRSRIRLRLHLKTDDHSHVIAERVFLTKRRVLTELSLFWFDKLREFILNDVVTLRIEEMPEEACQHREQLEGHTILVKKAEAIPLEAIVRGYITGEQQHLLLLKLSDNTSSPHAAAWPANFEMLSPGGDYCVNSCPVMT